MEVLTLMNQISTLNNRVGLLHDLLSNTITFNPVPLLDLVSYLNRLQNIYKADRNTLLTSLQRCLSATSANVTSVCQSIIDNQATNAYEYYGANGPGNDFFAQQNTLALQAYCTTPDRARPPDYAGRLYIDELPSFAGSNLPITGEAAFVSFADRPVPDGSGGFCASFVDILALEPDAPLSTNNVSTKVRANPAASSPFTLWIVGEAFLPPPNVGTSQRPGRTSSHCRAHPPSPTHARSTIPCPQRREDSCRIPRSRACSTELRVGVGLWGRCLPPPQFPRARVRRTRARTYRGGPAHMRLCWLMRQRPISNATRVSFIGNVLARARLQTSYARLLLPCVFELTNRVT